MDTSDEAEKARTLRTKHVELRYYIVLFVFVTVVMTVVTGATIVYIRKDNDRTRHLICNIVQQVQLKAEDCR